MAVTSRLATRTQACPVASRCILTVLVVISVAAAGTAAVSPGLHAAQVRLDNPTNYADMMSFGVSLAIDGNTIVAAATGDKSLHVYERNIEQNGTITQVGYLTGTGVVDFDAFGSDIDVSGNTIVAGASFDDGPADTVTDAGAIFLFSQHPSTGAWSSGIQVKHDAGVYASAGDHFGGSVAIDGDIVVVGAPDATIAHTGQGAAYVFDRNPSNGVWSLTERLLADDATENDMFGSAVDIVGSTIIVGARRAGQGVPFEPVGAAYVFRRTTTVFDQVAKLTGSDIANNEGPDFGVSVALYNQELVIVGAVHKRDVNDDAVGAAYIFRRVGNSDVWNEEAKLQPSGLAALDGYGNRVDIHGDTAIVSHTSDNGPSGTVYASGSVSPWFYNATAGVWEEQPRLYASDAQIGDILGSAVAMSAELVVGGAAHEDGGPGDPGSNRGAVYVWSLAGCPENQYASTLTGQCEDCPFGKRGSMLGSPCTCSSTQYYDGQDCIACPADTVYAPPDAAAATDCLCATGFTNDGVSCHCDAGHFIIDSECRACPPGTDASSTPAGSTSCPLCAAGTFNSNPGGSCNACGSLLGSEDGATECTPAASGFLLLGVMALIPVFAGVAIAVRRNRVQEGQASVADGGDAESQAAASAKAVPIVRAGKRVDDAPSAGAIKRARGDARRSAGSRGDNGRKTSSSAARRSNGKRSGGARRSDGRRERASSTKQSTGSRSGGGRTSSKGRRSKSQAGSAGGRSDGRKRKHSKAGKDRT